MADDSRKRTHDDIHDNDPENGDQQDESSSDDDLGPALPSAAPPKKKRKLPYEKVYVAALPRGIRYSKSLMHKEQLAYVQFTGTTDFLITTSIDGTVKFWKKDAESVEFVKEFKAHDSEVVSITVSHDGRSLATAGADHTVKIFDVVSFDLLSMLELDAPIKAICWIHGRGSSLPLLAVARDGKTDVQIFDGRGESTEPIDVVAGLHRSPIHLLAYSHSYDCVISADEGGMLEHWSSSSSHEKPEGLFEYKSSTNLFEFKKAKSVPCSLNVSPNGLQFATFSFPDRKVRIFDFASGKLHRTYDESLSTLTEMQQAGTALQRLEDLEFGRRMAVERELENPATRPKIDVVFDESGNFIFYGSLLGVKAINTLTNRVVRVYGADEPFRALNLALHQGAPPNVTSADMAASANPLLQAAEERAPLLVATGSGKIRFYVFSNDTDISKATRDVQNEKPRQLGGAKKEAERKGETGTQATLHTTLGDVGVRLFPDAAPKAVENFATHAKRGYYDGTIFHRVIRKFMIQGGDPLGDGTGGESIWGKEFEDEFSSLKHDKPYTLSMANAGPNTNASQFFITTVKTPWLDGKHTVFGRVTAGMDVLHRMENVKTYKEKPEDDIKVVSISPASTWVPK